MRLQPTIRDTEPHDLPTVHAMIERAYRGPSARAGWTHEADLLEGPRTSLNELEAFLAEPRQRLLSAWHDNVPIGCVAVTDRSDALSYLGQLCVEPKLQIGGIGSLLITGAEHTAVSVFKASRIEMTVIDSRSELIAYYVRRGYRVTGERRDFPIAVDPPLFMTVLEKPLVGMTAF